MIREVVIANYQSLRKVKLRLGQFTVITGPTGSGKSALVRAVQLLAFNAPGTDYVTHGEKTVMVTMLGDEIELDGRGDEPWLVSISRGGKNAYHMSWPDDDRNRGDFIATKLAGKVPDEVKAVLRLGEVNFAGQFDRPYLLDSTGSEVARVLGKLTNVTMLYRAAQEANRRRLASVSLLKTRQGDLAALAEAAKQYENLPRQGAAVAVAEEALARMQEAGRRRARLASLAEMRRLAADRLALASAVVPEPPSMASLEELAARRERLRLLTGLRDSAALRAKAAAGTEVMVEAGLVAAQEDLDAYTAKWGVCPTCGQPVAKTEHTHQ